MDFIDNKNSLYKTMLIETKKEARLGMHSFHRYYGKLIPAIPRTYIREFTKIGDTVFDPFSGSGTTALEAKFNDRNFFGFEINPLSVSMARVKTGIYDLKILNNIYISLKENCESDNNEVLENEIPYCINRDHWFKGYVQRDMAIIQRNIYSTINNMNIEQKDKYIEFCLASLSAIVKNVSNADTATVFPGISKRIRALEEQGKNEKDVFGTYFRGLKKRIKYYEELVNHHSNIDIILRDSSDTNVEQYRGKADLIVTNPPYISSVRYAETMKLELYWMGVINNTNEYNDLSKKIIGNDKIEKKLYSEKRLTNYEYINEIIEYLYPIDQKNARVVYDFFTLMENVISNMSIILKPGKKVVMKISDSKIRKYKVETGYLLTKIAENYGFTLFDVFTDKINDNSRSLTTARNTYSDIITEDYIIIWEKKHE